MDAEELTIPESQSLFNRFSLRNVLGLVTFESFFFAIIGSVSFDTGVVVAFLIAPTLVYLAFRYVGVLSVL